MAMIMTKLKAHVYRDRRSGLWLVDVDHPGHAGPTYTRIEKSWSEAMIYAYALLKLADEALMYEVHKSRSGRRYFATDLAAERAAISPHGRAVRKFTKNPFKTEAAA